MHYPKICNPWTRRQNDERRRKNHLATFFFHEIIKKKKTGEEEKRRAELIFTAQGLENEIFMNREPPLQSRSCYRTGRPSLRVLFNDRIVFTVPTAFARAPIAATATESRFAREFRDRPPRTLCPPFLRTRRGEALTSALRAFSPPKLYYLVLLSGRLLRLRLVRQDKSFDFWNNL